MPFFQLVDVDDGENIALRRASHRDLSPFTGDPLPVAADDGPVRFEVIIEEDDCYGQYDPDLEEDAVGDFEPRPVQERRKDAYEDFSVMSGSLVAALRGAGVDNLDVRDAELRDAETGELLPWSYVYVHIVGRRDCATWQLAGDDGGPDRLVIHPDDTGGLQLFRLADRPSTVVVSEHVAEVLAAGRFRGLRVLPLPSAPRGGGVEG